MMNPETLKPKVDRKTRQSRASMSNSVGDIISKLEAKFSEQPSTKNSVMTTDGGIVRIPNELWKESPVLRKHSVSGISHKVVAAPKSVLVALIKAYEDDAFLDGIQESFDMLAAASELEFKDLTSKCLDNLRKIEGIDASKDFPSEISVGTVMRFFKVLLDSPLRTYDVYEDQLSRIARYCANDRNVMTNVMNLLKQSLEEFGVINLEGIPINFEAETVPVAIYERMGKLQTVVILGTKVIPVNLFGSHINLDNITIADEFYLKYGVYLLYLDDNDDNYPVYYKNIQDDSAPFEVLRDCRIFITKRDFVFAAHDENDCHSISLWTEDQKFERIYQSDKEIESLDFDHSTRILAVQRSDDKLLLFRLETNILFLLEERVYPDVTDIFMSGSDMFIVRGNDDECWIETNRVAGAGYEESSQPISEQPNDREVLASAKKLIPGSCLYHSGGSYFLNRNESLELLLSFPLLDETKTLMTDGELHAISELWMSP